MGDHRSRPYLIGGTLSPTEYDDQIALTQYVWKYYPKFLTSLERRVGAYTVPILSTDDSPKVRLICQKLNNQFGDVADDDVIKAMANGRNRFMDDVRDRLLRNHSEEISINRCPSCERVLRTPRAQQCSWCKHDWH